MHRTHPRRKAFGLRSKQRVGLSDAVGNLNTHDQDHYMRFELAESDYDYRIVFSTGQGTTQFHVRIP
jgi:hypothetical protein